MRRALKWGVGVLVLLLVAATVIVVRALSPAPPVALEYSRATTYLTEPRHSDGSVDYLGVVRREQIEGVTVDNNAAIPLLQAVGPACLDPGTRGVFLERLGLESLPEEGAYLQAPETPQEDVDAEWLARHEGPLERVAEAAMRSRFHIPFVTQGEPPRLVELALPRVGDLVATPGRILLARGRHYARVGEPGKAWRDALLALRLGCLSGQHVTPLFGVMSSHLRIQACGLGARVARDIQLTAEDVRGMLTELRGLPTFRRVADHVRVERLFALDTAFHLLAGGGGVLPEAPERSKGVDPNQLLREVNVAYDFAEAALEAPTVPERLEALRSCNQLVQLSVEREAERSGSWSFWISLLLKDGGERARSQGKLLAYQLLAIAWVDVAALLEVEAAADARLALLHVALALAGHRADNGEYPDALEKLVPAHLEVVPQDLFGGAPFPYRLEGDAYVLYSVGPNGVDDGGDPKKDLVPFRGD